MAGTSVCWNGNQPYACEVAAPNQSSGNNNSSSSWQNTGDSISNWVNSAGSFIKDILGGAAVYKAADAQQNQTAQQGNQPTNTQPPASGFSWQSIAMIGVVVAALIALMLFAMRKPTPATPTAAA